MRYDSDMNDARPSSVDEILALKDIPAIGASEEGFVTYINEAFTKTYGWTKKDLYGSSLTKIMPAKFREAHQFGFSRFLATEKPRVAGQPLPLEVEFKDGTVKLAEHFILADKKDNEWHFAATITLRNE